MSTLTRAAALAAATGLVVTAGPAASIAQSAASAAPTPRTAHAVTVVEGDQASVVVKLAKRATHRTKLRWRTKDGTARAGTDYAAVKHGRIVFHRGEKKAKLMVSTLDDAVAEAEEYFVVKVRGGKTGLVKPKHRKVRVVVTDDDLLTGTPTPTPISPGPPPSM